jgi:hypothetical protein
VQHANDGAVRGVHTNHQACVDYALRFVRGKFSKLIGEVDEVIDIRRRHKGSAFEHAFDDRAD